MGASITSGKSRRQTAQPPVPGNPCLLFCWHVRVGFYRGIDPLRIRSYALFFYDVYLKTHLEDQESFFARPSDVAGKMRTNQRKLHRLFSFSEDVVKTLGMIEEKLEENVRYERTLLGEECGFRRVDAHQMVRGNIVGSYEREYTARLQNWQDRFWDLD